MVKQLIKDTKRIKLKQAMVNRVFKEELTEKELKHKIKKLD